uniref:C2H2-type domain-containing protein n=1 Tax=Sparus aurata TaxID=8175 RepID=A0A671WY75_SPAAU
MCGAVQLLRVSVHERMSAAAEDFLLQVEKGEEAAEIPALRAKLTERLTAAAEEIVALLEETVAEYEDRVERSEREICRQRRLLDAVLKPQVKLHRADLRPPADLNQTESKRVHSDASSLPVSRSPLTPRSPSTPSHPPVSPSSSAVPSDPDPDSDWTERIPTARPPRKKKRGRPPLAVRNKRKRSTPAQSFVCQVCGRSLQGKGFLLKHVLQVCGNNPDCRCGFCGEHLDSSDELAAHLKTHQETSKTCSFCGKTFQSILAQELHVRLHTGEKPYSCDICGKKFSQRGNLNSHIRVHAPEKPFKCKECSRTFCHMTSLERHMQEHCGEEEVHTCSTCGQEFSKRRNLQRHMVSHRSDDTDKPKRRRGSAPHHRCKVCRNAFDKRSLLVKHVETHLQDPDCCCGLCGHQYESADSLSAHLRSHREIGKHLRCVRKEFPGSGGTADAPEDPHRRETLQLQLLWEGLQPERQSEDAPEDSHRRAGILLQPLWKGFHSETDTGHACPLP